MQGVSDAVEVGGAVAPSGGRRRISGDGAEQDKGAERRTAAEAECRRLASETVSSFFQTKESCVAYSGASRNLL